MERKVNPLLKHSFRHAYNGLIHTLKNERNMRIHGLIGILAVCAGVLLNVPMLQVLIILVFIGLVLAAELFNTSLERIVDIISPEYNELARIAKDASAGAVFVLAFLSFVAGLLVYIPALIKILNS